MIAPDSDSSSPKDEESGLSGKTNRDPKASENKRPPVADAAVPPDFLPLRQTGTNASARAAAALENFASSSENPKNWSNGRKWKISMTVAVTGLISTAGSAIGVPGIHSMKEEFGIENDKVAVLITTFYVLGLGYV